MTETTSPPDRRPAVHLDAYEPAAVEAKWRRIWEERGDYRTDLDSEDRPFYNLAMFPYPSAEGLHVGHILPYAGCDIYGRWRRLHGDNVFEPMGFDAFGIHSENYALKIGEHPAIVMRRAVANFREQLKRVGAMFDWAHQVNTSDPAYYRWTQWLFLKLFDAGLVEWRDGAVLWCPSCLTVLANEQVEQGRCERCESVVETRWLRQWWLKITKYSQELLDALDTLDWSESTKLMQRNWIGRREGARIVFDVEGCERSDVAVFTTRPDTLFGATFLVIAADHPHLEEFAPTERRGEINAWRNRLPGPEAEPDFSVGINLGATAIHPLTGERLQVWAAPYVLYDYGTGAIMAVPAHDERDHAFATTHGLPILEVIRGSGTTDGGVYTGHGAMVNSGDFDGMPSEEARKLIVERLENTARGEATITYRLRDWLISRQRYWGPPIPIIHCTKDGQVPVPYEDLPVLLPEVEDFRPTGTGMSPLATVEEWVNVTCPRCGGPARRETDVSDTFVDSSWYYLRYPSTDFDDRAFDDERTRRWLPVDMYIGGNEHAVRHLLYSRFVMRALHDMGLVSDPEPFTRFRAHGMIVKDGNKMSKSRGNVVNPDDYLERFGADTFRLFLMFLGPYTAGGDFRDEGIAGVTRFLHRVWRATQNATAADADDVEREHRRHRLIGGVDEDIAGLHYNTAIAQLMEFAHHVDKEAAAGRGRRVDAETLLLCLAPFAPHITEELWQRTGHEDSIHTRGGWPAHDPTLAARREVEVAVQVNGKLRGTLTVPAGTPQDELRQRALELPRIVALLGEHEPRKVIAVVDRVVNLVV
jgi:leucyl-tRNA synthetase